MRVLVDPTRAVTLGSKGEFGWDGWLGCYMEVVPEQNMTFLMMTQKKMPEHIRCPGRSEILFSANNFS